jgi:hypothetical protein
MVHLGDMGQAEAHYDALGDSFNLVQYRCTVCDECTTSMEITLGTPDGTPRKCMSSGSLFSLFQDSISVCAR